MLAQLQQTYESQGVKFVSLTIEDKDTPSAIEAWLKKAGAPGLLTGKASRNAAAQLHKLGGEDFGPIPSTVFITPSGTVSQVIVGAVGHGQLEQAVLAIKP
ncbi:MAG: hypothetical protein K8I27_04615 [Planctomycetes bacterium]|nr:hypothetical protein [Planctomycetota bacterium]